MTKFLTTAFLSCKKQVSSLTFKWRFDMAENENKYKDEECEICKGHLYLCDSIRTLSA